MLCTMLAVGSKAHAIFRDASWFASTDINIRAFPLENPSDCFRSTRLHSHPLLVMSHHGVASAVFVFLSVLPCCNNGVCNLLATFLVAATAPAFDPNPSIALRRLNN